METVNERVYLMVEDIYTELRKNGSPSLARVKKNLRNFLKTAHITRNGTVLIGYWFKYRKPQAFSNTLTDVQMEKFWKKFHQAMENGQYEHFKGSSKCRICGESNGSMESRLSVKGVKLRVPQGYAHYLEEHDVMPDTLLLDLFGIKYK